MTLIDTHCHIHSQDYSLVPDKVLESARQAGVETSICVGTSAEDSRLAVKFAATHGNCVATVGLHPHDAKLGPTELKVLNDLVGKPKVVAIGESGLDYYYNHSPKDQQVKALEYQMDLALEAGLPMIFHIRDAFDDFWPLFDARPSLTGVIHSFTAGERELAATLQRGLMVGLNGIMTFTRNPDQLATAKSVPLQNLVLETDAPFLTPTPYRGKVNEPKNVLVVAEFLADLRGENLTELCQQTTTNARKLFKL